MQYETAIHSVIISLAITLSLASTSTANSDTANQNIFNADVSVPVIQDAVTEFESVCLPFILHETELTQDQDRAVFNSRMIEGGYVFEDKKEYRTTHRLDKFTYSPTSCPLDLPEPVTEGKYTTFFGNSPETVVTVNKSIRNGKPCEILAASKKPVRYTNFIQEFFKKPNAQRTSAYLTWQDVPDDYLKTLPHAHASIFSAFAPTIKLKTSFPPANSCQVSISRTVVNADLVEASIIQFDEDWTPKPVMIGAKTKDIAADHHLWTQCSTQDDEHYVYTVGVKDDSLSLKVEVLQEDTYSDALNCKAVDGSK